MKDFGVEFGHTEAGSVVDEISGKTSWGCHFPAPVTLFQGEINLIKFLFWDLIKHYCEEEELSEEVAGVGLRNTRGKKFNSLILVVLLKSGFSSFTWFGIDSRGGKKKALKMLKKRVKMWNSWCFSFFVTW